MLSMKAKYGLRAALYLAGEFGRGPVLISELAAKQSIPKKFLEQILLDLKNEGILQSKLGKSGGYYLSRHPEQVTMGDVIEALDGPFTPVPCVSKTAHPSPCDECKDELSCAVRMVMTDVRDAVSNILDRTTLAQAITRSEAAAMEMAEALSYQI